MAFEITKDDVKRSQKCPPGMHLATLVTVEDEYLNENGTTVQAVEFETDKGYLVRFWFNDKFKSNLVEFIEAADNIKFDLENMQERSLDLKDYVGKKVAISVSHNKDKNGKIQAQIDNFFSAAKVPF